MIPDYCSVCVCPQVLVVGGGDGGVVREVAKHSCVQEIHLCEIDQVVKPHTQHTLSAFPNVLEPTRRCYDMNDYVA